MWCYHKPGFEALLLAELQKQQQCNQFCDTLLKAEGVSVPVHSCVLSAVSPQVSFTLSSMPVPPAGQRRLLEFGSFGARTLLHVVRLLYSGEMAGECDKEKQEVISAAAMLGIHGLVEDSHMDPKSRNGARGGQHPEVGVQTEPGAENGARQSIWRREVRDGSILLWKEVLPDGQKDMGTVATQTEEPDINTALPTHPTGSLRTIDAGTLHSLRQTDSHFVHSHIPYAPVSLVYRTDDNETADPSSQPTASIDSAGHTSVAAMAPSYSSVPPSVNLFPNQVTLCAADPQSRWTGPPGTDRDITAGEDWESVEQFQDNIPEFINYFFNPDKEEGSSCRRAGRRWGPRVRGGRSAAASESRAESRPKGRRRGRLTEIVDVQDVGVSKLQKLFLQRGGRGPSRPGQGGGAVGRKLCVKTRELLKRAKRGQQYSTEWDISQSEKMLTFIERGRGRHVKKQSGRRNTRQQLKQDIPPAGRTRRARAKPTTSSPSSSSASSPSRQLSPCPSLRSPGAADSSPAESPLHPSSISPPAAPSQDGQPEHIDRLLEEVMMGLDILSNNNAAPRADPADQNSTRSLRSMCASSRNNLAQNKHKPSTEMESCPGVHGPPGAAAGSREVPLVQQQEEGELTDILDHFLQSFEQHMCDCNVRDKPELDGGSSSNASQPYSAQHKNSTTLAQTITSQTPHLKNTCRLQPARSSQMATLPQNVRSRTNKTTARRGVPRKRAARPSGKARSPGGRPEKKKRGRPKNVFSSKTKKSTSESQFTEQAKQLQQRPVVRLERGDALQVKAKEQGRCPSQEVEVTKTPQSRTKTETGRKLYPTRSRLHKANVEGPSLHKPGDQGWKGWKFNSNGLLSTLSSGEGPQIQPVQPARVEEQPEKRPEGRGEASALQPQGESEGAPSRGEKRRAEAAEASVAKKVCVEQTAPSSTETPANCVSEAEDVEDVIDVETVPASSAGGGLQREKEATNVLWSEALLSETKGSLVEEAMEHDSDEIISVDGDADEVTDLEKKGDSCKDWAGKGRAPAAPLLLDSVKRTSLDSTGGSEDEDIDVIGGSSPLSGAVSISWTQSPERGEGDEGDEDVDVV